MSYAEISAAPLLSLFQSATTSPASEFRFDLIITHEFAPSLQVTIWVIAARTYASSGQEVFLADYF